MSTVVAKWPREETRRLWAGYAGIGLAVLLSAAALLFMLYREQTVRGQQIEQIRVQAHILAGSVSAALAFNDPRTAQEFLDSLSAVRSLKAGAVYDNDGVRVAAFARSANTLPDHVDKRATILLDSDVVVTVPVVQGGTQLGYASLKATLEAPDRRMARITIMSVLVTLALLAIAALFIGQSSMRRYTSQLTQSNRRLQEEMEHREKAEEALRQSQKMEAIGQLAGGIAHDFNNLLGVIKGNLHLLRKRVAQGNTDVDRYVGASDEALTRAASLTQRILAYSRRQPLKPTKVNLNDVVASLAELVKHAVNEHVEIVTRLEADWFVLCDVSQMENVILNLANNAGDAMPEGGRLVIATRNRLISLEEADRMAAVQAGAYVELTVRDTGVGMDEETRMKATDPFFTTKPMGKGTGLGLSTAVGYIRQSQGHLFIESAKGRGTTVTILMPRARDA